MVNIMEINLLSSILLFTEMMQICAKLLQTHAILHFNMSCLCVLFISLFSSDTYLSFEYPSYFLSETGTGTFPINIIKQEKNATATENVYALTVQIKSKSNTLTNEDFITSKAELKINPNPKKVIYTVAILEDSFIEEQESFTLTISPVTNEVQWVNGDYTNTTITIIDDDGKKILIVIPGWNMCYSS